MCPHRGAHIRPHAVADGITSQQQPHRGPDGDPDRDPDCRTHCVSHDHPTAVGIALKPNIATIVADGAALSFACRARITEPSNHHGCTNNVRAGDIILNECDAVIVADARTHHNTVPGSLGQPGVHLAVGFAINP